MKMDAEFMQWSFKIAPCTKTYDHEWSTCPYVHEGEKMRRRDPRTHSCHACPLSKQKKPCPLGDVCQHAHNVYECGFHPDRFRTKYCRSGATCRRWNCFFAHSVEELRDPHAAAAAAAPDAIHSRSDSLDTFAMGAMEAALPTLPIMGSTAATTASLGSFMPASVELASWNSVSSGLCMPALGSMPDMSTTAAAATTTSGFLGMECGLSLVSNGSLSPGGSSSAMNSGSLFTSGINSGSLHNSSGNALLTSDSFAAAGSCPITLAPPAVPGAAFDHLLPVEQQPQWLLQQQPAQQHAAAQWLQPSLAWQQQQQQQQQQVRKASWPQQQQQQLHSSPAEQVALRQLLSVPVGLADVKNGDMLRMMAALGMDLHTLSQHS